MWNQDTPTLFNILELTQWLSNIVKDKSQLFFNKKGSKTARLLFDDQKFYLKPNADLSRHEAVTAGDIMCSGNFQSKNL